MKRAPFVFPTISMVLVLAIVGCNVVNTSPAPSLSVFDSSNPVPVLYKLAANNDVVRVSVDHSREGVVLSASLDEYELPTAWARVTGSAGSYQVQGLSVDPTGADAAKFVLGNDSNYYAKQIRLGTGTDSKILTATASGTSVVYADGTPTLSLPDSALSEANKKWYWDQMAAGDYAVWDGTLATPADLSGIASYASSLKSVSDAAWKSGRDATLAFAVGRVLTGTDKLPVSKSGGTWSLGSTDTGVVDTWNLDTYFKILFAAYSSAGSVDTTTAASAAE